MCFLYSVYDSSEALSFGSLEIVIKTRLLIITPHPSYVRLPTVTASKRTCFPANLNPQLQIEYPIQHISSSAPTTTRQCHVVRTQQSVRDQQLATSICRTVLTGSLRSRITTLSVNNSTIFYTTDEWYYYITSLELILPFGVLAKQKKKTIRGLVRSCRARFVSCCCCSP